MQGNTIYIGKLDIDHREPEYAGEPIMKQFDELYLAKPFSELIDYLVDPKPDRVSGFSGFTTDTERHIAERLTEIRSSAGIIPVVRVKDSNGNERSHSLTDIVGDAELIDDTLEVEGERKPYKKLEMTVVGEGHAGRRV